MRTLITVAVLCVFTYSGVGAILKTLDSEKSYVEKTSTTLAQAK